MKQGYKSNKINIITLGCSRNLVDSEVLMYQIRAQGYEVVHDSNDQDGGTVIINTCGFIRDAKQESIDTVLQYVEAKKAGLIEKIYVIGCLSERYKSILKREIPQVDHYFGVRELKEIIRTLGGNYKEELIGERLLTTPSHYAYLKISEGCDRKCSFCAIPLIKGSQKSVETEFLVREVEWLVNQGVRELILIAQDLTAYGTDLYGIRKLGDLLKELIKIENLKWIRLHYTYPAGFPEDILELMYREPKICNYLDIPFQHISDRILKSMRRGITKAEICQLIRTIREKLPAVALRTSLIVGYPGETPEEFNELKRFVEDSRFERLGVFTYSEEENTYSANHFKDDVPESVKQQRFNELMEIQKDISLRINRDKIGQVVDLLIDRQEGKYMIGRTEFDSPGIDNEVLIPNGNNPLKPGEFVRAKITKAFEYDLFGEAV